MANFQVFMEINVFNETESENERLLPKKSEMSQENQNKLQTNWQKLTPEAYYIKNKKRRHGYKF